MSIRNHLRNQWLSYLRDAKLESAGPIQRRETEQAFYAGAAACLTAITASVDFDAEEPSEQEVEQLQAIANELNAWFESWGKSV
jgi:hypothetical protein